MKRGYHSTQRKYFNTIPRTGFLGLALGYAVGLFATGALNWDGYMLQIAGAVIGTAIGYWIDGKYFAEKDVPVEEIEAAEKMAEQTEEE
ncbi:MAG TPA: hypothetical protein DDX51_06310 [Clostridiales bacterium]|nr:hypothetical protein [Clostridiales bacterium]